MSGKSADGLYYSLVRRTLIPGFIIVATLNLTTIIAHISLNFKNDLAAGFGIGLLKLTRESWKQVNLFDQQIWLFILLTLVIGALSILYLPGRRCTGPRTRSGFQPVYYDTGMAFYVLNMIASIVVISYFDMSDVYLKLVSFAGILTVSGFMVSVLIYLKGLFAPSPGVFYRTNNHIFDYYCGIELYPRIGKWLDLKQLINCRFGMWLWQLVSNKNFSFRTSKFKLTLSQLTVRLRLVGDSDRLEGTPRFL